MITVDKRISNTNLKELLSLIGKALKKYRHEIFYFSKSVYGEVCFFVGDKIHKITNFIEVVDYFGRQEDVGVFRFESECDATTCLDEMDTVDVLVNKEIKKIIVVNENQKLFKAGVQIYDVYFTRGIIFEFDGEQQLSFEKDVWLSEDIIIEQGTALIDTFAPTQRFIDDWSHPFSAECFRDSIIIEKP